MEEADRTLKSAMDTAVRLLARRNHAADELRKKLRQRGFSADITANVIRECERLRYIDDEETARLYFRELQRKGCGPMRIRRDMKQKGLWNSSAELLMREYAESPAEKQNAQEVFEKKKAAFLREKDRGKRKEKIFRFLYARGFSKKIISELIRENPCE
jgi:regulatory protein